MRTHLQPSTTSHSTSSLMKHIFSPTTCAASFPAGITSILTEFTRPLCHEISSEAPVGIKPNYIEWKLISSLIDSFPGSFNHITWPSLANEGWSVDVDVKSFRFTCGLFCANVKVLHPVGVDRPAVVCTWLLPECAGRAQCVLPGSLHMK